MTVVHLDPELDQAPTETQAGLPPVAALRSAVVRRNGTEILGPVDFTIRRGERWIVLGANGAGKTTLLQLCAGALCPTAGSVELFGTALDDPEVDLDELLPLVGLASSALADQLAPTERALSVVLGGLTASLSASAVGLDDTDRQRARLLLARLGCRDLAERAWLSLSEGERKRVLIARALVAEPELLLLDEPAAGLDLGGREALLRLLARLAADPNAPAMVMVSHHVEEIPVGWTHAVLLRSGRVVAAGRIGQVLRARALSTTFGLPISLEHVGGRWSARSILP